MLARRVNDILEYASGFKILDDEVEQFFDGHDFVVGNLECPISKYAVKVKPTGFKATTMAMNQLAKFNLLTLANNHIFDCGKSGAIETKQHVLSNNILVTGLVDANDNKSFLSTIIKNKSFSFLACATDDCIDDQDRIEYPRIVEADNPEILVDIQNAKRSSNYVIVIVHGGDEMIPFPKPRLRRLCESFIDAGADVVLTHHPHVIGGVHCYNNKFIFYSLGDFIFDGDSYLRRRGLILSLSFDINEISYNFIPTKIKKNLSVGFTKNLIKSWVNFKWKKISYYLQNDNKYDSNYQIRYMLSFFIFQLDRLIFLIRYRGVLFALRFIKEKLHIMPYYVKKILVKENWR